MADAIYASSPIMLDGTGQRIATALEAYNGTLETRLTAAEGTLASVKEGLDSITGALAPTEATGTASRSYGVGDCFIDANQSLCRVTQEVEYGASLVSGTNYSPVGTGGLSSLTGAPTYIYAAKPEESAVKAAHPVPCFVFVAADSSLYVVQ